MPTNMRANCEFRNDKIRISQNPMTTEPTSTFAERLRLALDARGIRKILPWAERIGAPESSVRAWLKGPTMPRHYGVSSIANDLRISREWLESGIGAMEPEQVGFRQPAFMQNIHHQHTPTGGAKSGGSADVVDITDAHEELFAKLMLNIGDDATLTQEEKIQAIKALVRNLPKPE